ncbi:MAG TPA: hypothetical protein PKY71_09495, partial [Smithellaceae bacterium]|nr:hypothetical protein [Smithellaceae bacterium]
MVKSCEQVKYREVILHSLPIESTLAYCWLIRSAVKIIIFQHNFLIHQGCSIFTFLAELFAVDAPAVVIKAGQRDDGPFKRRIGRNA